MTMSSTYHSAMNDQLGLSQQRCASMNFRGIDQPAKGLREGIEIGAWWATVKCIVSSGSNNVTQSFTEKYVAEGKDMKDQMHCCVGMEWQDLFWAKESFPREAHWTPVLVQTPRGGRGNGIQFCAFRLNLLTSAWVTKTVTLLTYMAYASRWSRNNFLTNWLTEMYMSWYVVTGSIDLYSNFYAFQNLSAATIRQQASQESIRLTNICHYGCQNIVGPYKPSL